MHRERVVRAPNPEPVRQERLGAGARPGQSNRMPTRGRARSAAGEVEHMAEEAARRRRKTMENAQRARAGLMSGTIGTGRHAGEGGLDVRTSALDDDRVARLNRVGDSARCGDEPFGDGAGVSGRSGWRAAVKPGDGDGSLHGHAVHIGEMAGVENLSGMKKAGSPRSRRLPSARG